MPLLMLLPCAIALLAVDWLQTRFIAKNPARFHEINPILGKHPSLRVVNVYFACCIALALAGAYFLPFWWAIGAGSVLVALETFITIRNYRLGIRLN